MVGGSHFEPKSAQTFAVFTDRYARQTTMPQVYGETGYEEYMQRHFADTQRYVFWMYMLNGAACHTYDAAGLHHMGVDGDPGLKLIWYYTTWQQAKDFPGATQVGMDRRLLEKYPWHRFEPITLVVTATDDNSGVDIVEVSASSSFTTSSFYTVISETTHIPWVMGEQGAAYIREIDRAGNASEITAFRTKFFVYVPVVMRNQ